jgi:methyl-accepting chemotaxis protein
MSENNNTLKERALLESIGENFTRYEEKIADLRVELTKVYSELKNMTEQYQEKDREAAQLRNKLLSVANQGAHVVFDDEETIEGEYVPFEENEQPNA